MDRKPFEQRFAALKSEAQSHVSVWKEQSKFILPTRGFFNDQPNQAKTPDYKSLIDSQSTFAVRTLAAGMTSGLTSPSRPWFKLGLSDPELVNFGPVRLWLDAVQNQMLGVFSKSNIYGALYSIYEEVGGFGTGAMIILPDFKDVIRARNFTIGEYYLGVGADGRVNAFGRECWKTCSQLVSEFGLKNCSTPVQTAFERGEADQWFKYYHLIEENDARISGKADFKNMPIRSVYWEDGAEPEKFLRVAGFEEFPVLAPRWGTTRSVDSYGKGPGWDSLGDIRMLQKMQKDKLIALDKLVDPPVQADASVHGEVNTLPGGVSRSSAASPNGGVRAIYQVNPDLNALDQSIDRTAMKIDRAFYADLFLLLANSDRRQITAREVVERHEEKLLMLGPVLERLENELLDPLISRTFGIMVEGGILPEPPEELQGMDLKVEYISMLSQAQKMVGTTAIEQWSAYIGNIAAVKPEVLDVMNEIETATAYGEMLGLPPKIIRSAEEIGQIRKQRQDAAAAAQQSQAVANTVQGAKVLSDTQIGNNSALDAMLGSLGPEPGGIV